MRRQRIWEEHKHPRDDRGRFAKRAGRRWAERVLTQMSAGRDMSAGGTRSGAPSGRIDLAALVKENAAFSPSKRRGWRDHKVPSRESALGSFDYNKKVNTYGQGEGAVAAVAHKLGIDGPPLVVSRSELDEAIDRGGYQEAYRAWFMLPYSDNRELGDFVRQFKEGKYYAGMGIRASGTHISPDRAVAERFLDPYSRGRGILLRMGLSPEARVIDWDQLTREHKQYMRRNKKNMSSEEYRALVWPGQYAMIAGYDAVFVPDGVEEKPEYIVFNRSALLVQDEEVL